MCGVQGVRKCGFLVNQLGKLTPAEKRALIEQNRRRYGLTAEQVAAIKLPRTEHLLEIYSIQKITNSKSKLSCVEKINHLKKLERALIDKLGLIKDGKIAKGAC